jgi:hypothetical protein
MKQSTLLQIFKTFSSKEFKEFEMFISTPLFNRNKNVIKLFSILKAEYPVFDRARLQKEYIFKKIYRSDRYIDENMKTFIHLLTKLAEKFMAFKEYDVNPFEEKKNLLTSLNKRKLDKLFIKHEKQIREEFNSNKTIELNILNEQVFFEKIRAVFYSERNDEETMYGADLKSGSLMITSFMIEMFRLINTSARIKYLGFDLEFDFVTEFMDKIDFEGFKNSLQENSFEYLPVINVYYEMYNAINETGSDKHYRNFKKSFYENAGLLGKSEQYILSTLMVNCLYYKHLKDRIKYDRELFEAFKILLSLYDYSGDSYLRSVVYTNILRLAVQFKEFEWTEIYIKEYSSKLKPKHRENMFNYSNAYLSFARGEFERSLGYASRINFDTFQMKYYLRDLQLSTLYELSQFEPALSLIDSYKHFIKKEKNYSPELKQGYLSFIACVQELIKIRLDDKKENIESLKKRISDSNPMRKQWLLEKIEELK